MIARLVFASLRRRGRQLALIAAAVVAAAASTALLGAFSTRLQQSVALDLAAFGPNLIVRPPIGQPPLPLRELATVRAVAGVQAAAAVRERALPGEAESEIASTAELLQLHPSWVLTGRWPAAFEVALGAAAAPRDGEAIAGRLATGERFDRSRFVLLSDGAADRIEVRADPERLDAVQAAIEGRVPGAEATPVARVRFGDAQMARRLRLLLLGIGAVTLALAALTVAAASGALLAERRVEIGLFLALGYSARRVVGLFARELLAVAVAAALVGEIVGELGASSLSRHLLGAGGFTLTPLGALGSAAAAIGIVGVAVAIAVRRVELLDPATVLRGD